MLVEILSKASCCSPVNFKLFVFSIFLFSNGFLSIFCSTNSKYLFFINVFTIALEQSVNASISGIVQPSLSFTKFKILICFSDFNFCVSISKFISSKSFFKYTTFIFLSCILLFTSFAFVPGVCISLIQSDTLQKYLFDIQFASSICLSVNPFSTFAISFISYCDFSFILTTCASSSVLNLPNGTSTLLPINIIFSNSFGML